MKRSPASSCSSTSSCVGSKNKIIAHNQKSKSEKPKSKRGRKNQQNKDKCQNNSPNSPTSAARRSSIYRGVTRHRWTGRFEAHLWDKSSWNIVQNKKGRQVYLGAYDNEEAAARTYDLAALKYWGRETILNFPIDNYTKELKEMQKVSKEEYLASLRRRSSGFSRGVSKYRGVARHHHNGRWEARIGRVLGNKYLYLGTFNTQEEAAAAYDLAAIEHRGANAVTNFDISNYIEKLKNKGVPLDHILRDPLPNCSTESEAEVEAEVEQPPLPSPQPSPPPSPPKQQKEEIASPQLQHTEFPPCVDTASAMIPIEDNELAWSFCWDSGLIQFPEPDLPVDNACDELLDLFDNAGFEDNIDLIFDTSCYGNKNEADNEQEYVGQYGMWGRGGCVLGSMEDENGKERLLSSSSSSSPSCSTITSVSCNYSV